MRSFFDDFEDNNITDGLPVKWRQDNDRGTITVENGDLVITPTQTSQAVSVLQDETDLFLHSDVVLDMVFQYPLNSQSFVGVGFRNSHLGTYWVGGFATGEVGLDIQ
ncbi:MAG: hypothetical protein R3C28_07065 [Pirellulaceae bacterium]